MTAINTTYASHKTTTFSGHFGQSITAFFASLATWNDARTTRNSLYSLTDRQLEDIGLCRGDVRDL